MIVSAWVSGGDFVGIAKASIPAYLLENLRVHTKYKRDID